jgi:exosortase
MNKSFKGNRDIKAIILDSGCDFGRCPLASRLSTALWPVVDKPAIEHLLLRLSDYGVKQTIICSNGDGAAIRDAVEVNRYQMDLKFSESCLPTGTAGCIRDAVCGNRDSLLLVLPASMVNVPDIETLIQAHDSGKCELTVVLNPPGEKGISNGEAAGIYVCQPTILEYIPAEGYCDIKESLIPEILRAGRNIYAARLPVPAGNFRNHSEYLCAISHCLESTCGKAFQVPVFKKDDLRTLWMGPDSHIDDSARIYGPVVLMEGACVSEGAIIFGPTIIGRNAEVGRNSLIVNSVLWDNSQVGSDCEVEGCVMDCRAVVQPNSILKEKPILCRPKGILKNFADSMSGVDKNDTNNLRYVLQSGAGKTDKEPHERLQSGKGNIFRWFAAGSLLMVFIWSYEPNIKGLWDIWQRSDEYSSGLLVPFLAVYVLWLRRQEIASCDIRSSLWGLPVFFAAQIMKFFGLFFMYNFIERLSIVISIAALVLLLFGWGLFRKVFTTLLFLCLMLPLPSFIHSSLILPLQVWSTSSAVFCLEILGYDVVREGNIIDIQGTTIAVAEACNGLRMIMAFFVIGSFVILLNRRRRWEKLVVLVSCLPIALLCNTIRLAITAIAFTILKGDRWETIFHDFGGYAMMPLALGIVALEFWLLTKIVTVQTEKQIVSVNKQSGS